MDDIVSLARLLEPELAYVRGLQLELAEIKAINRELLESLEALEKYWDGVLISGMPGAKSANQLVDQAKAAIRKARANSYEHNHL